MDKSLFVIAFSLSVISMSTSQDPASTLTDLVSGDTTINGQQPSSSGKQPVSGGQQPASGGQVPSTGGQQPSPSSASHSCPTHPDAPSQVSPPGQGAVFECPQPPCHSDEDCTYNGAPTGRSCSCGCCVQMVTAIEQDRIKTE